VYEIKINLGKELGDMLEKAAREKNISTENFIKEILNKYFVPLHTIDQEAMAKGYEEMAEINLQLAK
jgi:disulfide oxidoreductase YuzD